LTAITPFGNASPIITLADTAGDFDNGYGYVNNVAVGATGFFQVFAWTGPAGSQYTDASVTFLGSSPIFTDVTGTHPVSPNLPVPGTLDITGGNIVMTAVITPEPGTLALAGLGAAALLVFRRRK
jgi:hypothetical protein